MTLLNPDGTLLSKEIYKYEFDFAGNWNKMTTSVAVVDGRGITFEPSEVTYRSIMYYLDENMMKMAQPTPSSSPSANAANGPSNSAAPANASSAKLENSNTAVVPKSPAAKDANKKNNVALPGAALNAEQLNNSGTLELSGARANSAAGGPVVKLDSEPPPPPAPKPILKPVSGGVLNGTAISLPSPGYPETARRMRISGVVSVDVIVDETGKVISAVATSGPASLREVAVQAALHARFSPTKLSGQPVKVSGLINYKFALAQ
jgi:TonB family protein